MNLRLAILKASKDLIAPWARFLLQKGVSYREFDDVVRAVFVDIATKEFGIRGRPTNASRVAVLTGLTRKQIKKIRESIDEVALEETASHNQASDVLSAWYVEKDFVDEKNQPKVIPFEGENVSFSELVRRFGRDIPPRAMLRELKRTNAVQELPDGTVKALRRINVYGDGAAVASIERTGEVVRNFVSTIVYNLSRTADDIGRFERRSFACGLSDSDRKKLDELVRKRGSELIVELEEWIVSKGYPRNSKDSDTTSDNHLIGAGVYLFSDQPKKRV